MNKKAIIFLNGDAPDPNSITDIDFEKAYVLCADGAYDYASEFCVPDLVIGDFDSLCKDINVPCEKYPVKKDFTDSQLAVRHAAQMGCIDLDIYGAFGGRPDHELVNYSLLLFADSLGCRARLKGGRFDVCLLTREHPFVDKVKIGAVVSLVPCSDDVHILYTKGLLFSAEDVRVSASQIFTTSNTAVSERIEYKLKTGKALLFIEN